MSVPDSDSESDQDPFSARQQLSSISETSILNGSSAGDGDACLGEVEGVEGAEVAWTATANGTPTTGGRLVQRKWSAQAGTPIGYAQRRLAYAEFLGDVAFASLVDRVSFLCIYSAYVCMVLAM